jgi:hypothetical protein
MTIFDPGNDRQMFKVVKRFDPCFYHRRNDELVRQSAVKLMTLVEVFFHEEKKCPNRHFK